jgi:hypothetical protein
LPDLPLSFLVSFKFPYSLFSFLICTWVSWFPLSFHIPFLVSRFALDFQVFWFVLEFWFVCN